MPPLFILYLTLQVVQLELVGLLLKSNQMSKYEINWPYTEVTTRRKLQMFHIIEKIKQILFLIRYMNMD